MVSAMTLPIGLLMYGWAVDARVYWLVAGKFEPLYVFFLHTKLRIDLGVFIFSIGIGKPSSTTLNAFPKLTDSGGNWTCIQTYLARTSYTIDTL